MLRRIYVRIYSFLSVYKITPFFPLKFLSMDPGTNSLLSTLLKRLTKAEKKVESILNEIKDIKHVVSTAVRSNGERELNTIAEAAVTWTNVASFDTGGSLKRSISDEDLFDSSSVKKVCYDFIKEGDYVVVFTDGACENNGKVIAKAGIGVWWGPNHQLNVSSPVEGRPTNNTAEIQACIKALEIALENNITKVTIKTDSQFVINSITKWIKKWKLNNWKVVSGASVKNKEDFQKLDLLCLKLDDVKWEYIPGHAGHTGNEEADKLARAGAVRYKV